MVFTRFDIDGLAATLTFDLQNLIQSSAGASEYSLIVLSNSSSHSRNIMVTKSDQKNEIMGQPKNITLSLTLSGTRRNWLSWGFTSHTTQNEWYWRRSSQPISRLSTEKLKQTQQKQTCIRNTIYYNMKLTPKKRKPGSVASYHIWHGNGEGLFWFWHFINLSLNYLLGG